MKCFKLSWQLQYPRLLVVMWTAGQLSCQARLLPSTLTIDYLQHILSTVVANIYANHVQSPANVPYSTLMKSVLKGRHSIYWR